MVPVNPGFHTLQNLAKDYSQFEHVRAVRWKSKNIGLKGREIISLPLAPTSRAGYVVSQK
jgi:hypothetical protein